MRVFWPTAGLSRSQGIVVGWRLEDTLCVIGIVDEWAQDRRRISITEVQPQIGSVETLECLGYAHSAENDKIPSFSNSDLNADLIFWLNTDKIPQSCSEPAHIILYTPPDSTRLRFFGSTPPYNGKRSEELATQDNYGINGQSSSKDDTMSQMLSLINISKAVQMELFESSPRKPNHSPNPIVKSWTKHIPTAFIPLIICAQTLINVFDYPTPTPIGTLRNFSSTIDQCSLRLTQGIQGPERFKSTREVGLDIERRSERYIRFWNTVWLIFNDVILGYSISQIILLNSALIQRTIIYAFSKYLIELPITTLKWLNDWPVGLKLNTPLSQFFCTGLGLVIRRWGELAVPHLVNLLPFLVNLFAWSSLFGLTFTLSLLRDTIRTTTVHIHLCHIMMKYIFNWQLESLSGLWNLFRGKRWNVLRKRTDSYEYDVDQLFLGTLLFTVSAFLFPTVLTYFGLFALIRFAILSVGRTLAISTSALNSFPLFELMLRIKEPSRLPAGVHIRLRDTKNMEASMKKEGRVTILHILEVKNSPKSMSEILFSSS